MSAASGGTGQQGGYTIGDVLYADTASTLAKLPAGTTKYALTSGGPGIAPHWDAVYGSFTSAQDASNVNLIVEETDTTTDIVKLVAGTNITLTDNGSNEITIDAAAGAGGGWTRVTETTAARTAAADEFILVNNASCIITLPAAANNTVIAIKTIIAPVDIQIKSNAFGVRIDGTDYSTTGLSLTRQFEQISVISDGTHWYIY